MSYLIDDDLAFKLLLLLEREQEDGYNGCSSENYQLHREEYQRLIDKFYQSEINHDIGIADDYLKNYHLTEHICGHIEFANGKIIDDLNKYIYYSEVDDKFAFSDEAELLNGPFDTDYEAISAFINYWSRL